MDCNCNLKIKKKYFFFLYLYQRKYTLMLNKRRKVPKFTHSSSSYSLWCGMLSWFFTLTSSASSPVGLGHPSTLLHITVGSGVAGLWPDSPWTGIWFCSLSVLMWPWWWPCTAVCFWDLETYPGRAACSASRALLTNSSLSVWTNCSVCNKTRRVVTEKERNSERHGWITKWIQIEVQEKKKRNSKCGEMEMGCHTSEAERPQENTRDYLQRKQKETRKMNSLLHRKEAALHYCSPAGEENNSKEQQTIQLLLLQPVSLRGPPPLISNVPASVSWWRSWDQQAWFSPLRLCNKRTPKSNWVTTAMSNRITTENSANQNKRTKKKKKITS